MIRKSLLPILILFALLIATPIVTYAASPLDAALVVPFFEGYTAQEAFVFLAAGLIGFTQGLWPNVSLFDLVKRWLKVKDVAAGWIILGLSAVLAVTASYLVGALNFQGVEFTADFALGFGFSLYSMSQMGYQFFKKTSKPTLPS